MCKRLLIFFIILVMVIGLCACGGGKAGTASLPADPYGAVTEKELESLFSKNLYCMQRLLRLGTLPYSGEAVKDGHIYPVQDERFQTYAALKDYLCTVYTEATATALLENNGMPVYVEIEGRLCVDTYRAGGRGYYIDWTDRQITIDSTDETGCHFTVTGKDNAPSDEHKSKAYEAAGTAVYENGRLVLTAMIV